AFAATSLSCVAKEVRNPTYPAVITNLSPSDTYLRVRLHTLAGQTTTSAWIKGSDITALQLAGTPSPYITSSQWQCFAAGLSNVKINTVIVTPMAGTIYDGQPSRIRGGATPVQDGSYVAIRIDISGKIVGVVGVGISSPNTSAVHQSCWTSFKPGP
ncbi:MAG: hypothetical protein LH632_04640, partial [Rhodoferax sp.]|nr:hypothetical protein [Rhodoferax sp.]